MPSPQDYSAGGAAVPSLTTPLLPPLSAPARRRLQLLAQGTPPVRFAVLLLAAAAAVALFVFLNASQAFVLADLLGVDRARLGDVAGSLAVADQLVCLAAAGAWGALSDGNGGGRRRAAVYAAGFVIMAVALAAYPHAPAVYPWLLSLRMLFAAGASAAASMLAAVLADSAGAAARGRAAAATGLAAGVGALASLALLLPLPARFADPRVGLRVAFLVASAVAVGAAGIVGVGLSWPAVGGGNDVVNTQGVGAAADIPKMSLARRAAEGIAAARSDSRVLLAYIGSFLARGDTVIVTLFVPLWVYKTYIDSGDCAAPVPNDPDIKDTCRAAYVRASIIAGLAQTFALVGAPL
ncbi:hypothetical protein HK405_015594, partial [Cladochytrium tenue]